MWSKVWLSICLSGSSSSCVRGLITKELVVLNFNDIHILVCVGENLHSLSKS